MNRKLLVVAVVAVALGAIAFGVTRRIVCRDREPTAKSLQDIAFLTRELSLNPDQAARIKTLHTSLAATLTDCCARHCAARAQLVKELASDSNDTSRTEATLATMTAAYEQSERATLDHLRQIRASLNPGQRTRFDAMLADCMCRTCSMPGGTPSDPTARMCK